MKPGHRRIAHIEHHETDPIRLAEMPSAIRANGYRAAMAARGLADEIDIVSTTCTQHGGYTGALRLLARPQPPTAIFAALGPISLTSVGQAGHQIGANAARLLLERIADRDKPSAQVKPLPHPGASVTH